MKLFKPRGWAAVALAGMMVLGGCGDDPTALEDHADAEGLILRLNGQTIASYDEGTWTGELEVTVGQETAHIDVIFIDHDGDVAGGRPECQP